MLPGCSYLKVSYEVMHTAFKIVNLVVLLGHNARRSGWEDARTCFLSNDDANICSQVKRYWSRNFPRTSHFENHYHYVRDCIQDGFIDLIYCPTEDNVADIFTKSLSAPLFTRHRHGLEIRDITTMSGGVIK